CECARALPCSGAQEGRAFAPPRATSRSRGARHLGCGVGIQSFARSLRTDPPMRAVARMPRPTRSKRSWDPPEFPREWLRPRHEATPVRFRKGALARADPRPLAPCDLGVPARG